MQMHMSFDLSEARCRSHSLIVGNTGTEDDIERAGTVRDAVVEHLHHLERIHSVFIASENSPTLHSPNSGISRAFKDGLELCRG